MNIFKTIKANCEKGKKMISILVDPDKISIDECMDIASRSEKSSIDFFFVGSSILTGSNFEACIRILKSSSIPVIIFPGNPSQVNDHADGILLLSLISGRNAELLIGQHVQAAPVLRRSSLEIIPTGYMLIDGGSSTSASYMSGTTPIPHDKDEIAVCTAMAGEMLGLQLMYMDAGSGAKSNISSNMISSVKKNIAIPLIVGGGIRTPDKAAEICNAGADMIVVGNAIEKDVELISTLTSTVHAFNGQTMIRRI